MSACSTWLLRDIDYYGHVLPVQCTKCVNSFVVRFARKFLWKFPILQLLCSQARRRLQEELTQKPSGKPCDRAIDALCRGSCRAHP